MIVKLLGLQDMNFATKEGGSIDGVKLHYYFNVNEITFFGVKTGTSFLTRNYLQNCGYTLDQFIETCGKDISIDFDNKGKLQGLCLSPVEQFPADEVVIV